MVIVNSRSTRWIQCETSTRFNTILLRKSNTYAYVHLITVETLSEDEDERDTSAASLPADAHVPLPGGPFSALTPSMWPQDLLGRPNSAVNISITNIYFILSYRCL